MSADVIFWTAAGLVIGVAHATTLWRHAHCPGHADWSAAWRLPSVAVVLVGAALGGGLLPATLGWACGLAVTSGMLYVGSER